MEDHDIAEVERLDDIIIFRYKLDLPVNKEMAERCSRIKQEITKGESHKCIFVFHNLVKMDKSGRDYFASSHAQSDLIVAAFVAKSVLGRAILNFFIKLNGSRNSNKVKKIFKDEASAIKWLQEVVVEV